MLKLTLWLVACLALVSCQSDDAEYYLLPADVRPDNYDLTVFPHIENFKPGDEKSFAYEGIINITVTAVNDASQIVLHKYSDIEITSASISDIKGGSAGYLRIGTYDKKNEKQTLLPESALKKGQQYIISLSFTGLNSNALTGFYRSSYFVGLTRRWLVTTDFEPFGARRAFPSFDEPGLKATFKLTVVQNQTLAEEGYVAHFNTDIESNETRDGLQVTTFKTTPRPISTYLVCFILADFLSSPEPTYFNSSFDGELGKKPFRTIGRPSFFNARQDLTSQIAGPAVLNFITQKTGVGFGFDKVEQAGIPDFAAGAMENWGLVTYRENLVFWNENTGSTADRQGVVTVTAHELGHQWFGDLVTLHWWSDLWLNEGFATFFEFHAADQIREPDLDTSSWDLIGQFVEGTTFGNAFAEDGYADARPLTSEAYDQASIQDFFDRISYDKGGSILRMWMNILGEDLFYAGLSEYLNAQALKTGTPELLLAGFDKAIAALPEEQRPNLPAPCSELFRGWHKNPGYPVVTVERQGASLTITQERFLWVSVRNTTYDVPLTYSTDVEQNFDQTQPIAFLRADEPSATIQIANASADWIILNNQVAGYYRVNYDADNWDKLLDVLDNSPEDINELNQIQIIDDYQNIHFATDKIPNHRGVAVLKGLRRSRSLPVWRVGLKQMYHYLSLVADQPQTLAILKAYLSLLVKPAFEELGLAVRSEDSHATKLLRVEVARMACFLGMKSCSSQAQQLFSTRKMNPDVREIVLCEGVKAGDSKMWSDILAEALDSSWPQREDLLSALACTKDTLLLQKLVDMAVADEMISEQDALDILTAVTFQGPVGADMVLTAAPLRLWRNQKNLKTILSDVSYHLSSEEALIKARLVGSSSADMIQANALWKINKYQQFKESLVAESKLL